MSDNPWYSFYIGDYDRDTAHLSLLEHGAYLKLMNHYYAMREPLPSDMTILYRICRAFNPAERRAVHKILSEYFQNNDGRWVNKRCDREIEKVLKFINRQSAAAYAKAKPRQSHGSANPQPQPIRIDIGAVPASPKYKKVHSRGSRLEEDWELEQEWGDWAESKGLSGDEVIFQANKFKNHWLSTTKNPTKRNWKATWENWIYSYLERKNNELQTKKFK